MYWNHRVMNLAHLNGSEPWLEVREVYYEDDGSCMGHADICKGAETLEGLREHFASMMEAIDTAIKIGPGAVLDKSHFLTNRKEDREKIEDAKADRLAGRT